MAGNIINRYPRPMGITSMMNEYHHVGNPEMLDKIRFYMINQWLLSNGEICGINIELLAFAKFLDCDPEVIRVQMRDSFLSSKVWDRDKQDEMINALMGTQLSWAIEDRMEVERQLSLLKKSQGDSYKPFVTSEVNKTLSLKLSSSANMQAIIKSISGGGSINIFNQFNTQNNTQNQFITKEEAMKMVQDNNQQLIDSKKEVLYIEALHNIAELPEVIATKQQGIALEKNSHINVSELKAITDIYSNEDPDTPGESRHDTRRAELLDIDLDSES